MSLSRKEHSVAVNPRSCSFKNCKGAAEYDVGDVEYQYATWLDQDAIGTTSDKNQKSRV